MAYVIRSDHLGTPRSIARASDNVEVWRWGGEPFGDNFPISPTAGVYLTYNLRFAGQQYEPYTGYFQNWNRDYDPYTGRYVQSDPTGLAGGLSRYTYVGGNPISRTDPTGLYWFQQPWQAGDPIVGRENTWIVPGEARGSFIERNVPAGRTLAEVHDPLVDVLTNIGFPDAIANIPTMLPAYGVAIGLEILRSLGLRKQPEPRLMCPK